jgi:hypothetical protein
VKENIMWKVTVSKKGTRHIPCQNKNMLAFRLDTSQTRDKKRNNLFHRIKYILTGQHQIFLSA